MPEKQEKPVPSEKAVQVREWYPTPKHQQAPYYVFAPAPGQSMQQQQIITTSPAQPAQGYSVNPQPWTPYPVQQGAGQYPATGGWSGYDQTRVQQPVPQPQYQQPYQAQPQYQQGYPAQPQYQPYYPAQPQYPSAQRPWGAVGAPGQGGSTGRQSMETWQMPGQFPAWAPPAYNGYTGQYGTIQNSAPGYYR